MDALKTKVENAAKAAAKLYVDEWCGPLNTSQTDWDGEAWFHDRLEIGIDGDVADELWPIYQAALVAETWRLSREAAYVD